MGVLDSSSKVMQNSNDGENQGEQTTSKPDIPLKFLLCYTFLIQGLYRYMPGPILNDLGAQLHEKLIILPIVFTVRGTGCIAGVIIGSFVHQYLLHSNQKTLLIFLTSFLMSITAFGTAMAVTLPGIKLWFASAGICLGAMIAGINALYLHTNRLPSKTFCLTVYFFYGIGALSSPLLTRQYFMHKGETDDRNISEAQRNSSLFMVPPIDPIDYFEAIFKTFPIPFNTVSYAYVTISLIIFIESVLWLARYCVTSSTEEQEPRIEEKEGNLVFKNLTIFLVSLECFLSESITFSYGEFLPIIYAFGYEPSRRQTSEIMAFFIGCLCVSRLMAIFISWKIKPHNMRILGIAFVFAGCIIWHTYEDRSVTYFWIANGFIALGSGPLFGGAHTWIADKFCIKHLYIMPFFLMIFFSEMIMPWTFCRTANRDYPKVKIILFTISSLYAALLVLQYLIVWVMRKRRKKREQREKERVPLAEMLPASIRSLFTGGRHKDIAAQEESSTEQRRRPETNPHEIYDRISELKERISRNNEGVKRTFNQLHYSVTNT